MFIAGVRFGFFAWWCGRFLFCGGAAAFCGVVVRVKNPRGVGFAGFCVLALLGALFYGLPPARLLVKKPYCNAPGGVNCFCNCCAVLYARQSCSPKVKPPVHKDGIIKNLH